MNKSGLFLIFVSLFFLLSGCDKETLILPDSLYFQNDSHGISQVWRLERDGVTARQITFEKSGVEDFAVSPATGELALISGTNLTLVDAKGRFQRLIAKTQSKSGLESFYRNTIANPVFSPDGRTVAYALDGIHLFDLSKNRDVHALINPEPESYDALGYAKGVFLPVAWSPQGNRLLISMSYYEGYQLMLLQPGEENSLVELTPEAAICCQFSWTVDSKSILAATPFFTGTIPGLWRFNAQTGDQSLDFPAHDAAGHSHFYGWPYQSSAGDLTFFQANLEEFPTQNEILFSLYRSNEAGENIRKLLAQEFSISTALWSPDGSFVVIIADCYGEGMQMKLLFPETGEIKILIENASDINNLTWGP